MITLRKVGFTALLVSSLIATTGLTVDIRQVSEESFNTLDHDSNNEISRSEFTKAFLDLEKSEIAESAEDMKRQMAAMATGLKQRYARMDTNGDGSLSQDEFVSASANREDSERSTQATTFSKLDEDQDGAMSFEEYGSAMKRRLSARAASTGNMKSKVRFDDYAVKLSQRIDRRFNYMDENQDSVLTREEYLDSARDQSTSSDSTARFEAMDRDDDNMISQDEFLSTMKRRLKDRFEEFEQLETAGERSSAAANLVATLTKRFESLDADKDGQVSRSEMDRTQQSGDR